MLRKTMVLAAVAAALSALVPSMANAEAKSWTDNEAVLAAERTVVVHGFVGFTGPNGGVDCIITATAHLEPGSTGTVTDFDPSSPNTGPCIYSGGTDILCNPPLTVHQSTNLPWTIHATKFGANDYGIVVTGINLHLDGTGGFCPNKTITGNAYLTSTNPHKVTTLTVTNNNSSPAGTLHTTAPSADHVTATGSVEITPAARFGIQT